MKQILSRSIVIICIIICAITALADSNLLGQFDTERDLYLAHFDLKTDVDDVHSVAAVATMLADKRFEQVTYHAVAGAYGTQKGPYVPANELFELAFGNHWSDAHTDFDRALEEVTDLAVKAITNGGKVWIAEGGQSDFSAALIRETALRLSESDIKQSFHVVQHADWNEEVTTAADLDYVKTTATYHRIPDGNGAGNGTPGFRRDDVINWRQYIHNDRLTEIWEKAINIANKYNAVDGRYRNESILKGGLDFSDTAETCWIFGFNELVLAEDFFKEFSN